jgi:hypothetical protein
MAMTNEQILDPYLKGSTSVEQLGYTGISTADYEKLMRLRGAKTAIAAALTDLIEKQSFEDFNQRLISVNDVRELIMEYLK